MTIRTVTLCAGAILAAIALQATAANALTMAECSAKYKAAKSAGTLNGMKWNEFRKVQCGAQATAAPASTAAPARAPAATGYAVFPRAVDPRYSKDSPGKARMQTCLDQYRANKASNANAGLRWIEKGGGYYSECTKRLKGAA